MGKNGNNTAKHALALFRRHRGLLRTGAALKLGIHPRTLYRLRDSGKLEALGRGLFRLAGLPPLTNPDLVAVALQSKQGVICLLSALSLHKLTTQIPHEVYLALKRGAETPRLSHPPICVFRFSPAAFAAGVEIHHRDGIPLRVYSPEKTLIDCIKYRHEIGLETVSEALRMYRESRKLKVNELLKYASLCRVEKTLRTYLEALI